MAQFICNFYSQHMDLPWIWNRTKKKTKQDIKYYYKNKENNIYPVYC